MLPRPPIAWCVALALAAVSACRGTAPGRAEPGVLSERVESNVLRSDYAGSEICAGCHAEVYEAWSHSPMHRMTRDLGKTRIHAPFAGEVFAFRGDRAVMERRGADRYVALSSASEGDVSFRVTKVIGGRYREDFVGVEVDASGSGVGPERILPVSYLIWNGQWRYKGYSVLVRERPGLERGLVWKQACIFCHNTVPQLSSALDELYGEDRISFQGSASEELPRSRAFRFEITDEQGLVAALSKELRVIGGADAASLGADPRAALSATASATRTHFGEEDLIELGVGCEMCHGGSLEHARNPGAALPTFAIQSDFMRVRMASGETPTHAQDVNRTCAKCHTVLFSRYPYTWEGRTRRDEPGGSSINSGEARDFLLGDCSVQMTCTSCHDPHGRDRGERLAALGGAAGNAVCSGCHQGFRSSEALRRHTHHAPEGPGSACLNCHMPRKNMGLAYELTRYHRIGSPTDRQRVEGDRPLECALCHADRSVEQIVTTMERLWKKSYDRSLLRRLYGHDLRINALEATLLGGKPHERAVAADAAARAKRVDLLPMMVRALEDDYPLVRYFVHHAIERVAGEQVVLDLSAPGNEIGARAREWLERRPGSAAMRR